MIKRSIKTLPFENGKLYVIISGRRILLARCLPRVEIYGHLADIPVLGCREAGAGKAMQGSSCARSRKLPGG